MVQGERYKFFHHNKNTLRLIIFSYAFLCELEKLFLHTLPDFPTDFCPHIAILASTKYDFLRRIPRVVIFTPPLLLMICCCYVVYNFHNSCNIKDVKRESEMCSREFKIGSSFVITIVLTVGAFYMKQ